MFTKKSFCVGICTHQHRELVLRVRRESPDVVERGDGPRDLLVVPGGQAGLVLDDVVLHLARRRPGGGPGGGPGGARIGPGEADRGGGHLRDANVRGRTGEGWKIQTRNEMYYVLSSFPKQIFKMCKDSFQNK